MLMRRDRRRDAGTSWQYRNEISAKKTRQTDPQGFRIRFWDQASMSGVTGRLRMRRPVAAWTAFTIAGMTGGSAGSPRPVGG